MKHNEARAFLEQMDKSLEINYALHNFSKEEVQYIISLLDKGELRSKIEDSLHNKNYPTQPFLPADVESLPAMFGSRSSSPSAVIEEAMLPEVVADKKDEKSCPTPFRA